MAVTLLLMHCRTLRSSPPNLELDLEEMLRIGGGGTPRSRLGCKSWWTMGRSTQFTYAYITKLSCRYLVAIVSNQAGISLDSASKTAKADMKSLQKFKAKASAVLTHLDLPITLYAATSHDQFRKPRTAIWDRILKDHVLLEAGAVDMEASFFVGDAAGRTATVGQGPSKDFSCSDR